MTKLQQLAHLGQAIWLDYIRRSFIDSGDLQKLVAQGVRGVTSNPSILEKAIAGSTDYDLDMRSLVEAGRSVNEIYEALALDDIGRAADLLRPVYEQTKGADGYVSLEVSPALAHDTEGTIADARRLFAALDRPNIMIKVPATPAGFPAIETLIGDGININVTLIFSLDQYKAAAQAYIAGLEKLLAGEGITGRAIDQVASVASFFVSRVDTAADSQLEAIGETELQGKIANANARVAYAHFREIFAGETWRRLAAQGAQVQRPLWASTSTKNPHYPDTLYVDQLIGPHTVNTVPPATLDKFIEHGEVALTLEPGIDQAHADTARLADLGIDLDHITRKLLDDGVAAFAQAFDALLESIAQKRARILAEQPQLVTRLGPYQEMVEKALADMKKNQVIERIWAHDHTVWKPEANEISNRLGWLHIAEKMKKQVGRLTVWAESLEADGFTDVLLLGMGGSSLAPQVLAQTLAPHKKGLRLAVLDSTDPGAVLAQADRLNPAQTLFIVATKSGGTAETLSFFKYFYNHTAQALGDRRAGEHFVAITDPGSKLADLAQRYNFREIFINDPNIGGRYSALSYFGLVPAALMGVDLEKLLDRALAMTCHCGGCEPPAQGKDYGVLLGAIMGELSLVKRDKITFFISPAIASFGDWVEQLIAESSGKEGKGILPMVGEPIGPPEAYGQDRLFVYLRLEGDDSYDASVQALENSGQPMVTIHLDDPYDLGGQFFLWEMATTVACQRLNVNPFDQPNVEAAKALAREKIAEYKKNQVLAQAESAPLTGEALSRFLSQASAGAYVALQAYVEPSPETDAALLALRSKLRDRFQLATTVGYGPGFLHSTGQLHKGDGGNGRFIQFTADNRRDAPIPDEAGREASSISFGVLKMAQALGDREALSKAGRKVIRFHLGDVNSDLRRLADEL